MSNRQTLAGIRRTINQKGGPAMESARKTIIQNFRDDSYSSQALRYFSKVTLQGALPVFPALINMSFEAVGGNGEKTVPFGEAIVLISAAADLHDDVIDKSKMKGSKQTVLGKFDSSSAILAGDILLAQGFRQLTEAAANSQIDSEKIIRLVSEAILEISRAQALETQLHNRSDLDPDEYLDVIRLKAVVPEMSMKIGAVLGNAKTEAVETLGHFGRTYGINSLIIEEFTDLLNFEEVRNRLKNECPPLTVIYALQNREIKNKLAPLLSAEFSQEVYDSIVQTVLDSKEVEVLGDMLAENAEREEKILAKVIKGKMGEDLKNLLLVPLKYLEF
ncbi:MAG: polyprenyl synthetase family protein [Ignavibacteria bacterium]